MSKRSSARRLSHAGLRVWTLETVDAVIDAKKVEDAAVEVKSVWPDPYEAARRIGGHANAALGSPILWIIGLDEASGVVGVEPTELANWWAQVQSQFDADSPAMTELNVRLDSGETVVALGFDTGDPPYVVKNPLHGSVAGHVIDREVPWRSGTRTRTATRNELFRLLFGSLAAAPKIDPRTGILRIISRADGPPYWDLRVFLYLLPGSTERLVFPFHAAAAEVQLPEVNVSQELGVRRLEASQTKSVLMHTSEFDLLATGPGGLTLIAGARATFGPIPPNEAEVKVTLTAADAEIPAAEAVFALFARTPAEGEIARWEFPTVPES